MERGFRAAHPAQAGRIPEQGFGFMADPGVGAAHGQGTRLGCGDKYLIFLGVVSQARRQAYQPAEND